MTVEDNKRIVRQAFEAFAGQGVRSIQGLLAPNALFHQCGFLEPIPAQAIFEGGIMAGGRIHDREVRLDHIIGEGDIVALQYQTTGRYADPESPDVDGAPVSFASMTFVRVEDGRIAEIWNMRDADTLRAELEETAARR